MFCFVSEERQWHVPYKQVWAYICSTHFLYLKTTQTIHFCTQKMIHEIILLCIHALYVHTCLGIAYNQLSLLLDCLKFLMNQNKSKILRILITTTPFCRWTLYTCSLYFASKIPVKMKPLCGKQKVTRKVASNNTEEMLAFSKRPEQIKESIHLIKKRTLVLVF